MSPWTLRSWGCRGPWERPWETPLALGLWGSGQCARLPSVCLAISPLTATVAGEPWAGHSVPPP